MCELLGMSANVPTDICFSFTGLIQRGGGTGPHKDGWGITLYEGYGYRTFKDSQACFHSPIARFIQDYPIKSRTVISHIRQANTGSVSLENTHPFTRALFGRYWTYAHNGQLKDYEQLDTGAITPIGNTDSEYAFCWILSQLSQRYHSIPKCWSSVFYFIEELSTQLTKSGIFNMLLSDGEYLMAFCATKLFWITRRAPFGKAILLDQDIEVDFQQQTNSDDVVTVIATERLTTNETWNKMMPGECLLFRFGESTRASSKQKVLIS
ncbi:class II glutamine amidotransferase [Candidatus Williamhamiltonella defendens]|uniref:Class II glutamine amidotransferase n=1 Tax=Candidatus Williamhamiltonella defendens TaxID=138072 RepID=A0A2D3TF50_9ENTR|nr:class II glutamine amidotransferase [Candidatus Hamiltonella defensa]ATW34437.1 class II glutamine amidotransferase [Candidatus Hamiltonella defensa]AYB49666.1 class II glutamine amidotransferase [Candidatus Hamiltonella defensa]